ncbi:MAG: 50S ribosomal protein L11 methyltransferase [Marinilabiliaceae bacterium]|nr:50S ribosomal protein L11 methyltransferase [Marinilabiliaceae bacterium]
MLYHKVIFTLSPRNEDACDILMAQLGELGYESFLETEEGFEAYIQEHLFDASMLNYLNPYVEGVFFGMNDSPVEDKDWNKEWEENSFTPIVIDDRYLVRGPAHESRPEIPNEIVINPRMSFGSGHHETTGLMMRYILAMDVKGKRVLDMGCGTGILGLLACKEGAESVHGIDIDEWCSLNTQENCQLNGVDNFSAVTGDASSLEAKHQYDIVLANINRNILMRDMPAYIDVLIQGGILLLSGFLEADVSILIERAESLEMTLLDKTNDGEWFALKLQKGLQG